MHVISGFQMGRTLFPRYVPLMTCTIHCSCDISAHDSQIYLSSLTSMRFQSIADCKFQAKCQDYAIHFNSFDPKKKVES